MTLRVAIGISTILPTAYGLAIEMYNNKEGNKIYHQTLVDQVGDEYHVAILYTLRQPVLQEPEYHYVGSTGIDPNDPNWRDKWEQQALANASVTSQEGSGATEG